MPKEHPRVTDMFSTEAERDFYFKVRDDVGNAFARNFRVFNESYDPGLLLFVGAIAVAWALRAILLTIKKRLGPEPYKMAREAALQTAADGESL